MEWNLVKYVCITLIKYYNDISTKMPIYDSIPNHDVNDCVGLGIYVFYSDFVKHLPSPLYDYKTYCLLINFGDPTSSWCQQLLFAPYYDHNNGDILYTRAKYYNTDISSWKKINTSSI